VAELSLEIADWHELLSDQASRYARRYFRVAYGILHNAELAEDVCQQVFTNALEREHQIRQHQAISGWLMAAVVNESLMHLRRKKTEHRVLTHQARMTSTTATDPVEHLSDREEVQNALEQLDEPTRTVVVLRLMNGLSGNEVMTILECSASQVSRRLHQGLKQLRWILRPSQ